MTILFTFESPGETAGDRKQRHNRKTGKGDMSPGVVSCRQSDRRKTGEYEHQNIQPTEHLQFDSHIYRALLG